MIYRFSYFENQFFALVYESRCVWGCGFEHWTSIVAYDSWIESLSWSQQRCSDVVALCYSDAFEAVDKCLIKVFVWGLFSFLSSITCWASVVENASAIVSRWQSPFLRCVCLCLGLTVIREAVKLLSCLSFGMIADRIHTARHFTFRIKRKLLTNSAR